MAIGGHIVDNPVTGVFADTSPRRTRAGGSRAPRCGYALAAACSSSISTPSSRSASRCSTAG